MKFNLKNITSAVVYGFALFSTLATAEERYYYPYPSTAVAAPITVTTVPIPTSSVTIIPVPVMTPQPVVMTPAPVTYSQPIALNPTKMPSCSMGEAVETLTNLGKRIETSKTQCAHIPALQCYLKVKTSVKKCLDDVPNFNLLPAELELCLRAEHPAWKNVDPSIIEALRNGPTSCRAQLQELTSASKTSCLKMAEFSMPSCLGKIKEKETRPQNAADEQSASCEQ